MIHLATQTLTYVLSHLLNTYGYWAVLLFVGIESTGIPFPGETMLLIAAVYAGAAHHAGTAHHLAIALVIVAAAAGTILGDNLGFWVGREGPPLYAGRAQRYRVSLMTAQQSSPRLDLGRDENGLQRWFQQEKETFIMPRTHVGGGMGLLPKTAMPAEPGDAGTTVAV